MHAHAAAILPDLHQAAIHLRHRFTGPHVDYVGVALAAFISWIGVSGPGEVALIAAGIGAAHHEVDITGILAVAWVGAMAGGVAGWLVGHRGGRALITRPGPLHRHRLRMLEHGDRIYERRGLLAVYFAPSWMAGISGMRWNRFVPANAISTVIWVLLVGMGAYLIGPSIADVVADVGIAGIVALVLIAIATVGVRRRRRSVTRR